MSDDELFLSRDELLLGLPARRASILLFTIESRTAQLVAQSRQAMATYLTERSAEERERAFLDALSQGRTLLIEPRIQDIERYAAQWATLVPDDDGVRAAVIQLLGQKYVFTRVTVPNLWVALSLDKLSVCEAYERLYNEALETVCADQLKLRDQVRWSRSALARRLENLPPFWTAFALSLTETVGEGILALPIALASIGPTAGVVVLVVLGLVNVLTITMMVEAIARNGSIRYGTAYFGRLVSDYLGRTGMLLVTITLLVLDFLLLIAYYAGIGTTLAAATSIPAPVWIVAVFAVGLYFLTRRTLDATIATAIIVGALNVGILVLLSLVTLPHLRGDFLAYVRVPFINGAPFEPAILGLIFGVVLLGYAGHKSAANIAKIVLVRDPGGRSLILGNVAAMLTIMALYSLWVVSVNGSIAPETLNHTSGTALTLVANLDGPGVNVLSFIFVVLSMGLGTVYMSLSLFYQVREWLPGWTQRLSAGAKGTSARGRLGVIFAGEWVGFWIAALPTALVFLLAEYFLLTEQDFFTPVLSLIGVILIPLLSGIFPVLLLAASRRRGEYVPAIAIRLLGSPPVLSGIFVVFLLGILLHGLVIWQEPLPRAAAFLMSAVVVVAAVWFVRQGLFRPRGTLEIQIDDAAQGSARYNITANGRSLAASITLRYADGDRTLDGARGELTSFSTLGSASIQLPPTPIRDLKVWIHQVSAEGNSEGIAVDVEVITEQTRKQYMLTPAQSHVLVPMSDQPARIEISFESNQLSALLGALA